jgi:hypothetical protein
MIMRPRGRNNPVVAFYRHSRRDGNPSRAHRTSDPCSGCPQRERLTSAEALVQIAMVGMLQRARVSWFAKDDGDVASVVLGFCGTKPRGGFRRCVGEVAAILAGCRRY